MSEGLLTGTLVVLAIVGVWVAGILLTRWGRPKTAEERQERVVAYNAERLPAAVESLGRGIRFRTDVATARALVEEHLARRPKRFVARPGGTWTVRGIADDDLEFEFVASDPPELRATAFRDHDSNVLTKPEWELLKTDLEGKARKAGIATEPGPLRGFTRQPGVTATGGYWVPAE